MSKRILIASVGIVHTIGEPIKYMEIYIKKQNSKNLIATQSQPEWFELISKVLIATFTFTVLFIFVYIFVNNTPPNKYPQSEKSTEEKRIKVDIQETEDSEQELFLDNLPLDNLPPIHSCPKIDQYEGIGKNNYSLKLKYQEEYILQVKPAHPNEKGTLKPSKLVHLNSTVLSEVTLTFGSQTATVNFSNARNIKTWGDGSNLNLAIALRKIGKYLNCYADQDDISKNNLKRIARNIRFAFSGVCLQNDWTNDPANLSVDSQSKKEIQMFLQILSHFFKDIKYKNR